MKHAAIYIKAYKRKYNYMNLLEFINEHEEWSYINTYMDYYGSEPTEYDKLIECAISGEIDIIVTDSVARFGSDKNEFVDNMKSLMKHQVVVYFLKEEISSDDPHFPKVLDALKKYEEGMEAYRAEFD